MKTYSKETLIEEFKKSVDTEPSVIFGQSKISFFDNGRIVVESYSNEFCKYYISKQRLKETLKDSFLSRYGYKIGFEYLPELSLTKEEYNYLVFYTNEKFYSAKVARQQARIQRYLDSLDK